MPHQNILLSLENDHQYIGFVHKIH